MITPEQARASYNAASQDAKFATCTGRTVPQWVWDAMACLDYFARPIAEQTILQDAEGRS